MYNNLALIFGHLVGDYFFQSADMGINKDKPGHIGNYCCVKHCIVYSFWITVFVLIGGWRLGDSLLELMGAFAIPIQLSPVIYSTAVVFVIGFITHYPIDRYSLAKYWIKMIKQSNFDNTPLFPRGNNKRINYRSLFIPIIYVVIDNGFHLILMWLFLSMLGK